MSTNHKCALLVVDDEPYILTTLSALLAPDFEVYTADCGETAQKIFQQHRIDLILTDQKMPRMSGVQLLEWVRESYPQTIRLLMTGFAELEDAVEAINRGKVYRYLFKPWRVDELIQVLREACQRFKLERQNEELLDQLAEFHPVTSYGDGMLSTAATVEAPDPVAALEHLIEALTAAVPAHFVVDRAEIMTEARQQRELDLGRRHEDRGREISGPER